MDNVKELQFDEATHTYRYNGVLVAGVTSVLENVGLSDFSMVPPHLLAQAQAFGCEVHKATEKLDKNEALQDDLSEAASLYLCHYIKFLNDLDVEIIEVEKKVFCKKYIYAGTLDRISIFKKKSHELVLFDIKTGVPTVAHNIQTAAYDYAHKTDKRKKMDRYTLYISKGGYRLSEPYKSRQDFDVFLSALSVYNYKKRSK